MSKVMRFSREFKSVDTVVDVGNVKIGGKFFAIAAGPCAIENQDQYFQTAKLVKKAGANLIRGSVFKPRSSPYSFQGLGREGLKLIKDLGEELDIPTITEVMDPRDIKVTANHVDVIQIGARNMQNFDLLKEASKSDIPIILKRGLSATVDEWLNAAEYLMVEGNENIILCERGIRTFSTQTRNTLDLSVIPLLKMRTHLPIIVDPSHATGNRDLIIPVSKAAIASNADGILVEVHNNPDLAMCDGAQSLPPEMFADLIENIKPILEIEKKVITGTTMTLDEVRRRINYVDEDIIDLIANRLNLVPALVEFKKKNSLPVYQPDREKEITEKYVRLAAVNDVNPTLIRKVFNLIISEMRLLQAQEME
ncbi:2-dehydro-3-deoxyphosphooctonate aldolase [Candidatus Lokiarchaeum ossiferum]|uniref:2-dehydro-3-deoxyphosphooctonate aldolase n=1 Tax=Candidatus Lokiarchaeum ossiferum TaxID=2951803 RepID=A0ABY6HTE7_9ARCH|nr:2-dehydro-3-deoxyphosphooctonate aldolase [Candidatus Lokiarchaeum sp. B-35]